MTIDNNHISSHFSDKPNYNDFKIKRLRKEFTRNYALISRMYRENVLTVSRQSINIEANLDYVTYNLGRTRGLLVDQLLKTLKLITSILLIFYIKVLFKIVLFTQLIISSLFCSIKYCFAFIIVFEY